VRFLGLIVRIVLILFIIRMIVMFFRGLAAAPRRTPVPPGRAPERIGGELVRDSQCGTYVARTNAIGALIAGKMEYFCSTNCRDRALGVRH
jgi:uncharacterized protein